NCADVVSYLLQNRYLPRSVAHCLNVLEECIGNLPRSQDTLKPVRELNRRLDRIKPEKLCAGTLHAEVDRLQIGISAIHDRIGKTWFT
ncbi:MAG: alpha-E domain-containing protein, partial [Gammaproteobacteria bacterium]